MGTVSINIAAELMLNKGCYPGDPPSYALIRYRNKFNGHFSYYIVDHICNLKYVITSLQHNSWNLTREPKILWITKDPQKTNVCQQCCNYADWNGKCEEDRL